MLEIYQVIFDDFVLYDLYHIIFCLWFGTSTNKQQKTLNRIFRWVRKVG